MSNARTAEELAKSCKHTLKVIPDGYRQAAISEMTEVIQTYLDAAADAARAEGWQPIETAPRDGTYILMYGDQFDGKCAVVKWDADAGWWCLDDGKNFEIYMRGSEGKYWKPIGALPAAPEAK